MAFAHMEAVARRKANGGPGWAICKAEWVSDVVLIEGGVPRLRKSGKYKGLRTWKDCKQFDRVAVTEAEIRAEEAAYEATTGNCHKCEGKGETVARVSVTEGKTYRPCRRCGGSGKASNTRAEG